MAGAAAHIAIGAAAFLGAAIAANLTGDLGGDAHTALLEVLVGLILAGLIALVRWGFRSLHRAIAETNRRLTDIEERMDRYDWLNEAVRSILPGHINLGGPPPV